MAVPPLRTRTDSLSGISSISNVAIREEIRRRQVVTIILWVIIAFQLLELPGAILSKSTVSIGTVLLGLALCAVAMLFNRLGKVAIVSILLIVVIDLGCGLMLLTTPMGLDVSDLPVFDVLIVSELIAVSLLPALSVFPVAASNIVFIIADLALQPRTPELKMLLTSTMGYDAVIQPICLQIMVAVVTYVWVRSAFHAIKRADRAEEVAELRKREAEQKYQLDTSIRHLLQTLVYAANGDRSVRASLGQDNVLWQVGNALNLLLARLRRSGQAEYENERLRTEVGRLNEMLHEARVTAQQPFPSQTVRYP